MSFLKKYFAGKPDPSQIKCLPVVDKYDPCTSCTGKFPSSVKIDLEEPLYESSKTSKLHFLIPTGKTDWNHDACDTENTVPYAVNQWIEANESNYKDVGQGQKMKVNTTSMAGDALDIDVINGSKSDVIILPYFVRLKGVTVASAATTLDTVVPLLLAGKVDEAVASVDTLEKCHEKAFVLLCSHTTRDKRCGITAPIMQKEFNRLLAEKDMYRDASDDRPDGVTVTFTNHVGGHKFAANVLCYLATGEFVFFGRVKPEDVEGIVEEFILGGGKVWAEKVRACAKYEW